MITNDYEMVIAQHSNFTIVVQQSKSKAEEKPSEEKKDGEVEKKEII
jgi:hypothetical protein